MAKEVKPKIQPKELDHFVELITHMVIEMHEAAVKEVKLKCPCTDCAKWRLRNT